MISWCAQQLCGHNYDFRYSLGYRMTTQLGSEVWSRVKALMYYKTLLCFWVIFVLCLIGRENGMSQTEFLLKINLWTSPNVIAKVHLAACCCRCCKIWQQTSTSVGTATHTSATHWPPRSLTPLTLARQPTCTRRASRIATPPPLL